jgi:hypothetical protein
MQKGYEGQNIAGSWSPILPTPAKTTKKRWSLFGLLTRLLATESPIIQSLSSLTTDRQLRGCQESVQPPDHHTQATSHFLPCCAWKVSDPKNVILGTIHQTTFLPGFLSPFCLKEKPTKPCQVGLAHHPKSLNSNYQRKL